MKYISADNEVEDTLEEIFKIFGKSLRIFPSLWSQISSSIAADPRAWRKEILKPVTKLSLPPG